MQSESRVWCEAAELLVSVGHCYKNRKEHMRDSEKKLQRGRSLAIFWVNVLFLKRSKLVCTFFSVISVKCTYVDQ